ncbi:MAG: phage head-tail connector protein [Anaerolineae bacterium]|nr:phage head-tail connector protein [Anaerolineae bacterium]
MYTTLEDLKTYLNITTDDDDDLLTDLIERATQIIDTATGRTFAADSDSTRKFDALRDVGGEGRVLFLDEDLCQLTSVVNGDSASVSLASLVTEPRNRAPWYALRLKLNSDLAWTYGDDPHDAIQVTGRWAFSTTPPADIAHACIRLAASLYRQKDTQTEIGDLARATLDGVLLLPPRLPRDVMDLLAPYRRITP